MYDNISSDTRIGTFTPSTIIPYQITSLSPNSNVPLYYKENEAITFNTINKASTISNKSDSVTFIYGAKDKKIKKVLIEKSANGNEIVYTKKYFLNTSEKIYYPQLNKTKYVNYITSPDGIIAIDIEERDGINPKTDDLYWVFTDHLGSITTLIKDRDNTKIEMSYDCWGNRRDPANWTNLTSLPTNEIIDRGYTGHEHLHEFGLIDMEARIYDPIMGRFLSKDPVIPMPESPASYNSYSYCMNNPMKYIDPSGNHPIVGAIIAIAVYSLWQLARDAYNNRDVETGKWNWFDFDNSSFIIGINTNTSFNDYTVFASVDWNNGGSVSMGFNSSKGFGYGSDVGDYYFPKIDYTSPERNALGAVYGVKEPVRNVVKQLGYSISIVGKLDTYLEINIYYDNRITNIYSKGYPKFDYINADGIPIFSNWTGLNHVYDPYNSGIKFYDESGDLIWDCNVANTPTQIFVFSPPKNTSYSSLCAQYNDEELVNAMLEYSKEYNYHVGNGYVSGTRKLSIATHILSALSFAAEGFAQGYVEGRYYEDVGLRFHYNSIPSGMKEYWLPYYQVYIFKRWW